jgi:FkbM family methyltransferase
MFNPKLKVYMLEPHPETFKRLSSRFNSKNISLFNKGLSSQKSTAMLYDYPDTSGTSFASIYKKVITEMVNKNINFNGEANSSEIKLDTLDEFVKEHNIDHIDLLKIDTEGSELDVLKGATNTIRSRKINAIHFEFNEMNIASSSFFKDFWDLLNEYSFYRLLPSGMLLIKQYNTVECEIFAFQNIVAILKK